MMRFLPLSALLLIVLAVAPTASAQIGGTPQDSTAYCDSLCRVPLPERIVDRNPPFMCDCMVIIGSGGSGGGSGEPLTPAEILDRMFADNERRVANVDNYTTVMTTSSAPMPVVLFYEKEIIEGRSTFQLISPAELADREAAASGQPTSGQMGEGVVALADALGGLLGGGTPGDPEDNSAGGESSQGGTQSSATGDGGTGDGGGSGDGLLEQIVDGIRDFGEGLRDGRGRFEQQQGIADDLFWNQELVGFLKNDGKREVLIDGTYYSCDRLSGHPASQQELLDYDLGPEAEGYRIGHIEMFVSDEQEGFFQPIAMIVHLVPPDGGNSFTMTRTHKDFRQDTPDGPIVPRRTSMTMEGIAGLVQGALDDVWTELQTISNVLVNNGPPTSEESAALIADAIERLGLN